MFIFSSCYFVALSILLLLVVLSLSSVVRIGRASLKFTYQSPTFYSDAKDMTCRRMAITVNVGYPNQYFILVYCDIPSRNLKQDSQDGFLSKVFPIFFYTYDSESPNSESPLCLKIVF